MSNAKKGDCERPPLPASDKRQNPLVPFPPYTSSTQPIALEIGRNDGTDSCEERGRTLEVLIGRSQTARGWRWSCRAFRASAMSSLFHLSLIVLLLHLAFLVHATLRPRLKRPADMQIQISSTQAAIFPDSALSYCKCICFSNSTIIPLYRPADPSKPCLSCTKQFCLDQKLAICRSEPKSTIH